MGSMQTWQQQSQHGQRPIDQDQTKDILDQYQHGAEAAGGGGDGPSH